MKKKQIFAEYMNSNHNLVVTWNLQQSKLPNI